MTKTGARPAEPAKKGWSLKEKIVFGVILVLVVALGIQLWRMSRPPKWAPTPTVVAVDAGVKQQWTHAAPVKRQDDQGSGAASQPSEPPPPVPKEMAHMRLKFDWDKRKWVPDRPEHPRTWDTFRVTPPTYFVSDEERRRFREYWMKEANTRIEIYCQLTQVCPQADQVSSMLTRLFDDANPPDPTIMETPEQIRARMGRWRDAMWEWRDAFNSSPHSVFSFAGLEQHRGPDQPKPPLEKGYPDAGTP
jgi:hypothetical protein